MGTLVLEPALPDRVKHELHGEPVLFSVREARLVSRGGAIGGAFFGALIAIGGALAIGGRGKPNVSIDLFGFIVHGDSPEGSLILLVAGLLGLLAGIGMIVASPIVYRMPGMLVVGTPTRILHVGRWRIHTATWREVESVSLGPDGSVDIKRYPTGERTTRLLDIVQPPHAHELVELIAGILRPGARAENDPAAPTPSAPAAPSRSFTFQSTHTPGGGLRTIGFGAVFVLLGSIVVVVFGGTLLSGDTIAMSVNDGPTREVGAGEIEGWIPIIGGLLFIGFGSLVIWGAWPRASLTRYVAEDAQLVVIDKDDRTASYEWRLFTGEIERRNGRRGVELRFPLRRQVTTRRGRSVQEVLHAVGVANADEVEAQMRRRFV